MGVKASLLLQHEKTFAINGQEVTITYRRMSPLDQDRVREAARVRGEGVTPALLEATGEIVAPQILAWNLDGDDGTPLAITPENICRYLPDEELTDLFGLINGRLGGAAEAGEDPNPSTTPS
jgi:hypothetical protein